MATGWGVMFLRGKDNVGICMLASSILIN
jgi:hypothetical protein